MLLLLAIPILVRASIGVGVGTGKIEVKDKLKAGGIYTLPTVTVFNTGDQTSTYTMALTLNETQPELKPAPKWFSFSPAEFSLEPGQSEAVTPTLHLPIRTAPGDYFAYLEAHPSATAQQGTTTVGVAAATKLSFSVSAGNVLFAIAYKLISLFKVYAPISYALLALVGLVILYKIGRRFIKVQISRVKK